MNSDVRKPFETYEDNVGRFFPKTRPSRMLELISKGEERALGTAEVQSLLKINRHSATKMLNKLCRAGILRPTEALGNIGQFELTEHACHVLAELQLLIGITQEKPDGCSKIRLDELQAAVEALSSKVHAKQAAKQEESKGELLPQKRPPVRASRRHRADVTGQRSLFTAFAEDAKAA